ncbi:Protein of unknown function [Desulfonispora thiosulfatigenes DSM 11270]|uniref:DUF2680 domain-containing protein n=1 Tax=Desulfonispora thiosulfatigenes DSM 11270 TaxID=656914 RepID=A0A1W1UD92_DESTI|nr:DUF2680 domain-containing protein [Desulfonispora thiosulfatigenes]SMB79065.1 Protein of unknown function [Desulfonispora thiosulfatigenes DSM 11270]
MIKLKKLVSVVTIVGVLGVGGVAFASGLKTPADITSELTGKTVAEVREERASGKTYGEMAKETGKLEEFKTQMLEQKKEILDQKVEEGNLTKEQADEIYTKIKDNQATCDGTSEAKIGQKHGVGFGKGQGNGMGRGAGMRNGQGMGCGQNLNR